METGPVKVMGHDKVVGCDCMGSNGGGGGGGNLASRGGMVVGAVSMGDGVISSDRGNDGGGDEGNGGSGGGVSMGVCARSAFAKEEDGVIVEEEGGEKGWAGECCGLAWSE